MADQLRCERRKQGAFTVWHRPEAELSDILTAVQNPGELLKESPKAVTWRTGPWVIKQSARGVRIALKQIAAGKQRKQAFDAAVFLENHRIPAARPVAYVERSAAGVTHRSWTITKYLDGCVDVEAFLDRMIANKAKNADIQQYLAGIASAVNVLVKAGVHHQDLAGKNILTRNGQIFFFIDLDAVTIGQGYTAEDRVKNHVQLYDSFCDRINDTYLEPFIAAMGTTTENIAMYMGAVKKAQKIRRARTEAIWKKEGR
jgi:hypothetical protein